MTGLIPFDQICDVALRQADHLVAGWFPHGRRVGHEFRIGNIHGDPGESLAINLTTGKWKDFSGEPSGHDLIDLRAHMAHGGDRVQAARELAGILGITTNGHDTTAARKERAADWQPMIPPPPDEKRPDNLLAGFDVVYEYTALNGRVTHYVGRIEARDDRRKVFVPIVFGVFKGVRGWHRQAPAAPRPLYGLNRLSSAPDARVILCEGEKAADAAQDMFPGHACISWFGGCGQVDQADFTPLHERDVIIWPDNDDEGVQATKKILKKLPRARMLRVDGLPAKADAANVSPEDPEAWLADRLVTPEAPRPNGSANPEPDDAALRKALVAFMGADAWRDLDIREPDRLFGDFLTTTSRLFVVGRTGLGKTMFGLGIAIAGASGKDFLHWKCNRAGRYLYIDGEMPAELIKQRIRDEIQRSDFTVPADNLIVFGSDRGEEFAERFPDLGLMPLLNKEAGHNWVMRLVDILQPDCVILDNVMSLLPGDQKDELTWLGAMPLVLRLTRRKVAQVWLDHTGHNAEHQYGSSTKGWQFDAIAMMKRVPGEEDNPRELAFSLSFDKARRRTPNNWRDFEPRTIRLQDDGWTSDGATGSAKGKLNPRQEAYRRAFLDALVKSPMPGRTTRDEWYAELVRARIAETIEADDDSRARSAKKSKFRKYLSELKIAGVIGVDGETVTDLSYRP